MPDIFGIDIAQAVADALQAAGNLQQGSLTSIVSQGRNPNDPTSGPTVTETTHTFQGVLSVREIRLPGSLVAETLPIVTMIGASIAPSVVPKTNDRVTLNSFTFDLGQLIGRDPASAVYEFSIK